jgi:hypothetical protein
MNSLITTYNCKFNLKEFAIDKLALLNLKVVSRKTELDSNQVIQHKTELVCFFSGDVLPECLQFAESYCFQPVGEIHHDRKRYVVDAELKFDTQNNNPAVRITLYIAFDKLKGGTKQIDVMNEFISIADKQNMLNFAAQALHVFVRDFNDHYSEEHIHFVKKQLSDGHLYKLSKSLLQDDETSLQLSNQESVLLQLLSDVRDKKAELQANAVKREIEKDTRGSHPAITDDLVRVRNLERLFEPTEQ